MRRDWPAARTMPATPLSPVSVPRPSCGTGRLAVSLSSPARSQARDIDARYLHPGDDALQHAVETVRPGRSRRARQSQHVHLSKPADERQMSGVHRHAEPHDPSARADQRRRSHVPPVDDGGRAEDQGDVDAVFPERVEAVRHRALVMNDPFRPVERAAQRFQASARNRESLFEKRFLPAPQRGLDQPETPRREGRDPNRRLRRSGQRRHGIENRSLHREGDDLDDGGDGAGGHHPPGCDRRDRDGFVDGVDCMDALDIHDRQTGCGRAQIGPPGEGVVDREPVPTKGLGQPERRVVLADIAGLPAGR